MLLEVARSAVAVKLITLVRVLELSQSDQCKGKHGWSIMAVRGGLLVEAILGGRIPPVRISLTDQPSKLRNGIGF